MKRSVLAAGLGIALLLTGVSATSSLAASDPCANKTRLYYVQYGTTPSVEWVYSDCSADTTAHILSKGTAVLTDGGGSMTLDPSSGNAFVSDWSGAVSRFSLNNSLAGSQIVTTGVQLVNPWGIAIDSKSKRLYVANYGNDKLLTMNLVDNVLSEVDLSAHGIAAVGTVNELRIDPVEKRLSLSDDGTGHVAEGISWISTVTNTGGSYDLGSGTKLGVNSFAIDKKSHSLFWSNFFSSANPLVGISTPNPGSPINFSQPAGANGSPQSVVVDESSGLVYWVNDKSIYSGNRTDLSSAKVSEAAGWIAGLAILKAPISTKKPAVVAKSTKSGRVFACSTGSWELDRAWSATYDAPKTILVQLIRDGKVVSRFVKPYVSKAKGSYSCRVTATNAAGASVAVSTVLKVKN